MNLSPFTWALLAALAWGVAPILEKLGVAHVTPEAGVYARNVGVVIGMLVFAILFPQFAMEATRLNQRTWLFLGAGGIVASVIGQIFFYNALKYGEASRVVPLSAGVYPLISFLLSVLLLQEKVTWVKLLGSALVISGAFLLR